MILGNTKKAFVSLFTVLLASLALAMAVGVSSVALKQIVLSSTSSQANRAFFAADSAIECALNYDIYQNFDDDIPDPATCFNGQNIDVDGTFDPWIFSDAGEVDGLIDIVSQETCVRIEMTKDVSDLFEDWNTQIEARGYNMPCEEININPRRVERAIRVQY